MNAKFRRTDALLLAPILLIGGVGYWMQQRAQKAHEPTRIEVRSLQILPPTPSDVARGFDTRVRLQLVYRGAEPRGWGISEAEIATKPGYILRGISQPIAHQPSARPSDISSRKFVAIDEIENRFDADNDLYLGLYRLKLHGVSEAEPIVFKGEMISYTSKIPPGQTPTIIMEQVKNLPWSAVVRQQGIQTPAPLKVSRYSGIKVTKIVRRDDTSGGIRFFQIEVTCAFAPAVASQKAGKDVFTPTMKDIYLVDAKGQRFRCLLHGLLDQPATPDVGSGPNPTFMFNSFQHMPTDTSKLKFHVSLSVNDFWPLEIETPVKEIPLVS